MEERKSLTTAEKAYLAPLFHAASAARVAVIEACQVVVADRCFDGPWGIDPAAMEFVKLEQEKVDAEQPVG